MKHRKVIVIFFLTIVMCSLVNGFYNIKLSKASGTFGKTAIGASNDYWNLGSTIKTDFTLSSDGATIVNMTGYFSASPTVNLRMCIYDSSDNLLGTTVNVSVSTLGWYTANLNDTLVLDSGTYGLACFAENTFYMYFDTVTNALERSYGSGLMQPPNPFSSTGSYNEEMSIYATYTTETATHTPDYVYTVLKQGSNTSILNSSDYVIYTSTSTDNAFTQLATLLVNSNASVQSGTYTGNSITMAYMNNSLLNFENGSIITISNWINASAIRFNYCSNLTINGLTVDGNGDNQLNYYGSVGILIYDCSNVNVTNAYSYHAGSDGIGALNEGHLSENRPITISNSRFINCHWNGATFGEGASGNYLKDLVFTDNEIAYCSNVGVSVYDSNRTIIKNNYIHNMNGTSGGVGGNAHWGLGVEFSTALFVNVINNTVVDCEKGFVMSGGNSSLVKNNNFTNCNTPIYIGENSDLKGFNVITNNTITNWSYNFTYQYGAMFLYYSTGDIISFNTLTNSNSTESYGIRLYQTRNVTIANNTINLNVNATSFGIILQNTDTQNVMLNNTIVSDTGISIASGCISNKLNYNNLTGCDTEISDSGTGTVINPSSSSVYDLSVLNVYDGSGVRFSVISNSTVVRIELSSGSILNIKGVNITLTSNKYNFTMNVDYFAYVMNGSVLGYEFIVTTTEPPIEPPTEETQESNILIFILVLFFVIINIVCILIKVFLLNIIVGLSSIGIMFVIGSLLNTYPITGILVVDISLVIFVIFCSIGNLISTFIKMR